MYNTVNIWTGIIRYIFKNYVLKIRPKNTQKKKKTNGMYIVRVCYVYL